ncbi:CPBP family intramembrane glutamic endopeptidase [uncultured Muriicola sp.]|uniref:CPBP family intramembrane glutamic endopeptidase n=1 Tax=uncultured Muriicola sp. TaxID=1583102 RepID=UPI002626D3B1|nr:CPBP family intramembrane glutamic endopeptidase [uncultured Muriicola sp.]
MLRHVWRFVRKPSYVPYSNLHLKLKWRIFLNVLGWNFAFGIGLALFLNSLATFLNIDIGDHKTEDFFENYSSITIFFLMVLIAPIVEELIFRGPLIFFKSSSYFPWIYYFSCLLFGLVHLGNFDNANDLLWLTPVLVAPQIVMGFFLGFLRVRLGLRYAVLMHMSHNGIIFLLISSSELL